MSSKIKKTYFSKKLLEWFATNHRPMPWKGIKNPYYIWLSEIILQQTRVEQGLSYYEHFVKKYPTVFDLANAAEDVVMKSWEGLGYYSRARNLHATAKYIAFEREGIFPSTYEDIKTLKGVGPYTAAAIASFAFDLPHAVVDGNVYRVYSRYFGIETPIDSSKGKKEFAAIASDLLNPQKPADYNQALMDFGATYCTPKKPKCADCLFKEKCTAYQENRTLHYPLKSKKITKRHRYFNYLVIKKSNDLILTKRTKKDIWTQLYEFPMIETDSLLDKADLEKKAFETQLLPETAQFIKSSRPFNQTLTHQKIHARFWEYKIEQVEIYKENRFVFASKDDLSKFAFPKIIDLFLKDNSLYLELF